jgi:hypothetical protein
MVYAVATLVQYTSRNISQRNKARERKRRYAKGNYLGKGRGPQRWEGEQERARGR